MKGVHSTTRREIKKTAECSAFVGLEETGAWFDCAYQKASG